MALNPANSSNLEQLALKGLIASSRLICHNLFVDCVAKLLAQPIVDDPLSGT